VGLGLTLEVHLSAQSGDCRRDDRSDSGVQLVGLGASAASGKH